MMLRELIGMVAGFVFPPRGWLLMNGQVVSKSTYPELAAVIPEAWEQAGGIFLPDMQARVLVGAGQMENEYLLGEIGGLEQFGLNAAQNGFHHHSFSISVGNGTPGTTPALVNQTVPGGSIWDSTTGHAIEMPYQELPNMPPYLVIRWCIYAGR